MPVAHAAGTPRRRAHLVAICLLVAASLWVERALLPHVATHVWVQEIGGNDSLLHAWSLGWAQHALANQPWHLFDANIFFPQPGTLLYSDHLLGLAVPLAPLRLFTDNLILIHNLALISATMLNALAMYWLAFDLTRNVGAALVGAVIYGFAPFRFQSDRLQIQMLAAWWLPVLLLAGRRAVVTGAARWSVVVAAAWAMQAFTGIYLTAFFAPFWAAAVLWWAWQFPPWRYQRGWIGLALAHAATAIVIAPSLHAYRSIQATLGVTRSPVLSAILGLHMQSIPTYLPLITCGVLALTLYAVRRQTPTPFRTETRLYLFVTVTAILLAFGPTVPLPFDHGWVRGPYTLLMKLPGFTALRAPGRMIHIAVIGVAVLGAGAVAGATTGRGPLVSILIPALVAGTAFVEGLPPAFPLIAISPTHTDPVIAWVARQPDTWRLVDLPLGPWISNEQLFQYRSTGHWRPIANGAMGIFPPLYGYLLGRLAEPFDQVVASELRALGLTHVVGHTSLLTQGQRDALARATLQPHPALKLLHTFPDGNNIFALRPRFRLLPTAPPGDPLPRNGWQVSATADTRHAPQAIDDDPTSVWRSWGDLEHIVLDRWHDDIPFMERWAEFLKQQPTQLTVELPTPTPVSGVVARLGGTDPLALGGITVETSLDGQHWTVMPGQFRPLPDLRVLIADAPRSSMAFAFSPPMALRYLRIGAKGFEWQVGDLTLLRAPALPR